jgi:hypothetical protein
MARPKKASRNGGDAGGSTETEMDRTTVFLPKVMSANLDCLALTTGEAKAVLIRQGIAAVLREHGLNPYQRPQITVSYNS